MDSDADSDTDTDTDPTDCDTTWPHASVEDLVENCGWQLDPAFGPARKYPGPCVYDSYITHKDPPKHEVSTRYCYDGDGRLQTELIDSVPDEPPPKGSLRWTYGYSPSGLLIWKYRDAFSIDDPVGPDGGWTGDRWVYTYDESCRMVTEEIFISCSSPDECPAQPVDSTTYRYEDGGRRVIVDHDANVDGTLERRSIQVYGESGELLSEEQDDRADGSVNSRLTYEYNASLQLVMMEMDHMANGKVDQRNTYTYDARGNQIGRRIEQYEGTEVSGLSVTAFSHDAFGNLVREQVDQWDDGAIDYDRTYSFACW